MSVPTPEEIQQVAERVAAEENAAVENAAINTGEQTSEGNPKWREFLDPLPEEFHSMVRPVLEKWDKGVQERFQEFHDQYDVYKPFVENKVDPEYIERALYLVQELENNPADIVQKAIDTFGLDFVAKAAAEAQSPGSSEVGESYWDETNTDITQHPQFQAMTKALEELQGRFQSEDEAAKEAQEAEEFSKYLDELEKTNGQFDKMYVAALMSQGMDGAAAVKQYQTTVNQAAALLAGNSNGSQKQQPPVVMGGDGTTGSGLPEQSVNVGAMKNSDINELIVQMLSRQDDNT